MDKGGIDRLSYLPDHIRDNILYFLNTKSAVQTSVLSTRWKTLWKHLTHLNFDRDSFPGYSYFKKFLKDAMEVFRGCDDDDDGDGDGDGDDSHIVKLSYEDRNLWRRDHLKELDKVMAYVASHRHIRHVSIRGGSEETFLFRNLVGAILDCDLDALELGRVGLDMGRSDWRGFRILESLVLVDCKLHCDDGGAKKEVDFFDANKFPCLKNLVLSGCDFDHSGRTWFKISGPQLLNLEIYGMKNLDMRTAVEIVAPKLKFLSLVLHDSQDVPKFSPFSLPVLDGAYIGSKFAPPTHYVDEQKKTLLMITANFVNLLQGLHNATSLRLDYQIIKGMSKIRDELKRQPCPFTRLKCLKVSGSDHEPYSTIPDQVISYFLKGSSSTNPAAFLQFV